MVLVALSLCSFTLSAQEPAPNLPVWLSGCWRMLGPGQQIEEVWLSPAGGALVGMSRTVARDSLRSFELMVVRSGANGLVLEATPSGQPPANFLAAVRSDTSITFENLTHDFPQLIRYTRVGGDSLVATISGTVRERQRTITYEYARVSCTLP